MNARRLLRLTLIAAAASACLGACEAPQPKPKPVAPPPEVVAIPKTGVVGHVAEIKERAMTQDNWKDVISGLFAFQTEAIVTKIRYEVTVLYDDSTAGVVKVDEKPDLHPGQRVRVTGRRIEVLSR